MISDKSLVIDGNKFMFFGVSCIIVGFECQVNCMCVMLVCEGLFVVGNWIVDLQNCLDGMLCLIEDMIMLIYF